MKKQEVIHLHGLGTVINNGLAKGTGNLEPEDDFSEIPEKFSSQEAPEYLGTYDDLGVYDSSIHKSKTDHKRAVLELFSAITDNLEVEGRGDYPDPVDQRIALARDREEWERFKQSYELPEVEVQEAEALDPDYTGNSLSSIAAY